MPDATCSLPACGKPIKRMSLCYGHYMKQWRYGDPLYTPPAKWVPLDGQRFGELTVLARQDDGWLCRCDCGVDTFARAGDLNRGTKISCGDITKHRRLDVVGYSGAHSRLRNDQGDASSHSCVDCGNRAQHWSYDHTDPDELLEPSRYSPDSLIAYSLKAEHYAPRCVPCHKRFDLDHIHAASHAS